MPHFHGTGMGLQIKGEEGKREGEGEGCKPQINWQVVLSQLDVLLW